MCNLRRSTSADTDYFNRAISLHSVNAAIQPEPVDHFLGETLDVTAANVTDREDTRLLHSWPDAPRGWNSIATRYLGQIHDFGQLNVLHKIHGRVRV